MSNVLAAPPVHSDPAPRVLDVPVILFGFNRPAYLERVCASLMRQRDVALDPRRVFLMQDGAVSDRTGLRYAEDAEIEASVAAFRAHFPRGHVAASRANIGIAANIRRGEVLAFEALDADCGYFFEDDLELGPEYLRIMEGLRAVADRDPRIGYFAAYGDHNAAPPGPEAWLVMMDHHWAFGLKREPWRRLREWLAPYERIIEGADYTWRDHMAIYRWMEGLDVAGAHTSQDAVKTIGCHALGIARVMTDVCFGRYIGATGASFHQAKFNDLGFDRMEWVEGPEQRLAPGVGSQVAGIVADARKRQRNFRRDEFPALLTSQGRTRMERDRMASREDVSGLFRWLLDREAEESALDLYAERNSVRRVRDILLRSPEFRGGNPQPRRG